MKKLIALTAILLLLAVPALAADFSQTLKIGWTQRTIDLPSLAKWTLYVAATPGGVGLQKIDIPYTSGAGPDFTSDQVITVTGDPGATLKRYFTLTATSKNGEETAKSNEVAWDFVIPFGDVTTPMTLTIKVVVSP